MDMNYDFIVKRFFHCYLPNNLKPVCAEKDNFHLLDLNNGGIIFSWCVAGGRE